MSTYTERLCRRRQVTEFRGKDELVLVAPRGAAELLERGGGNRTVTLNRSGRAIWELCDGSRSLDEIIGALESRFPVDRELLLRQVDETLTTMARLGLVDGFDVGAATRTGTVFVLGVEDKPYFWWQIAIFLESLRGKLPAGWRPFIVVCNDGQPLSDELANILSSYGAGFAQGRNFAHTHRLDVGWKGGSCYSALNRVEALAVAANQIHGDDLICLLDSDIFLYGDVKLDLMPQRCAAPRNWHIAEEPFFASSKVNQGAGVDLGKLLAAIGCDATFRPGGVNVFVTGEVAKQPKFVADCFRFAEALFLLGRVAGVEKIWLAEMPSFTLAMTANDIPWDLLEQKEFLVSDCDEAEIPTGTFYHYYSDPADFGRTAFRDSKWYKHAYREEDFLLTDLTQFAAAATTDHEKYFFRLAQRAKERLYV
jgi:hypothetical protein